MSTIKYIYPASTMTWGVSLERREKEHQGRTSRPNIIVSTGLKTPVKFIKN